MSRESDHRENVIIRLKTFIYSLRATVVSRISRDPLLRGILILGSGTALSQVLQIIFVPIITRIYSPAIYGTVAVFGSLLAILAVAATMRYELTIPITQKEDDAEYLVILSFLITGIFTFILFVILEIWGDYLAGIFHFEFLAPYYWLFCVGFFGASSYQILMIWALRSKLYVQITRTKISQGIFGSVGKIIFGILSFGSFGLIFGDIISRVVGIGSLGKTIFPKMRDSIRHFDTHKLRSLAYRYRQFPALSLPSAFINVIALQVPTLILSSLFGFQVVGLYALSTSLTTLPVTFISSSISQAYTAESSEMFRKKSKELLPLYQNTTKKLFMFGAPIIFTGAIISPFLFPIIFGSAWKDAGIFVLPLSIFVIAAFVVSSTDRLELYGFNHWGLAWNISRTLFVLGGFYLAFLFTLTPMITILIFSSIMTIMYGINYMLNIKAIKLLMEKQVST